VADLPDAAGEMIGDEKVETDFNGDMTWVGNRRVQYGTDGRSESRISCCAFRGTRRAM
jgi:hypothetical protein